MVQYHKPVKKKNGGSGGKKRALRDKRRAHWGGFFARTKYEAPKNAESGTAENAKEAKESREARKEFRVRGGGRKVAAERIFYANLAGNAPNSKVKKTRVLNVIETPASRHYARENVVVKGAVILTEAGKARVTSRPGQHGVVNAILIEEKEREKEKEKETGKEKTTAVEKRNA